LKLYHFKCLEELDKSGVDVIPERGDIRDLLLESEMSVVGMTVTTGAVMIGGVVGAGVTNEIVETIEGAMTGAIEAIGIDVAIESHKNERQDLRKEADSTETETARIMIEIPALLHLLLSTSPNLVNPISTQP